MDLSTTCSLSCRGSSNHLICGRVILHLLFVFCYFLFLYLVLFLKLLIYTLGLSEMEPTEPISLNVKVVEWEGGARGSWYNGTLDDDFGSEVKVISFRSPPSPPLHIPTNQFWLLIYYKGTMGRSYRFSAKGTHTPSSHRPAVTKTERRMHY